MKTSAIVCAAAAFAAVASATPCDMGAIQGKLLPNATEGLKNCATTTGFDIWAISGFPTQDQATKIMKTRDCVAFLNQINERANSDIACDLQIGGVEKDFGSFLVSLLTGKTGNQTESSSSGSEDIEAPKNETGNGSVKPLLPTEDATTPTATKATSNATTPAPTTKSDSLTTSRAVLSAGLVAVAGLALQL